MINPYPIELDSGKGYVDVETIVALIPHQTNPSRVIIYTTVFMDGLEVKGNITEMAQLWAIYLEEEMGEGDE